MSDDWVVVQVGPVLQVPRQARFRNKQGWWYVYQRSQVDGTQYREVDPWSATKYQIKREAKRAMHLHAKELHMAWCVVRKSVGEMQVPVAVAYFLSRSMAEVWKPFESDAVLSTGWVKGADCATRL